MRITWGEVLAAIICTILLAAAIAAPVILSQVTIDFGSKQQWDRREMGRGK